MMEAPSKQGSGLNLVDFEQSTSGCIVGWLAYTSSDSDEIDCLISGECVHLPAFSFLLSFLMQPSTRVGGSVCLSCLLVCHWLWQLPGKGTTVLRRDDDGWRWMSDFHLCTTSTFSDFEKLSPTWNGSNMVCQLDFWRLFFAVFKNKKCFCIKVLLKL